MALTGQIFLGLVAALTVAVFIAVVALWPVVARATPARLLVRAVLLLLLNALVLLTAATQLNARYLFFADWTDLRGAISGHVVKTSVARGATASQAAGKTASGQAARAGASLPPLLTGPGRSGSTLAYTVKGPLSGIVATVVVQLPTGYEDAASATTRYPVLETFQGYPGSPRQWIGTMDLGGEMARQVAAKHMREALIVSPQVEIPAGVDTECVNGRAGYPQLETWLAEDVPNWIVHTFRVRTDRSSWASIGLSAGGWCAAMVAMLHPAQYSAAIVMGGYFRPELSPVYEPFLAGSALAARYDLPALAKRNPPPVAIWLETSHSDPISYSSSAALLKATRPPLALQAIVLRHAGHRMSAWQGLLPESLRWLGANLSGFGPVA